MRQACLANLASTDHLPVYPLRLATDRLILQARALQIYSVSVRAQAWNLPLAIPLRRLPSQVLSAHLGKRATRHFPPASWDRPLPWQTSLVAWDPQMTTSRQPPYPIGRQTDRPMVLRPCQSQHPSQSCSPQQPAPDPSRHLKSQHQNEKASMQRIDSMFKTRRHLPLAKLLQHERHLLFPLADFIVLSHAHLPWKKRPPMRRQIMQTHERVLAH